MVDASPGLDAGTGRGARAGRGRRADAGGDAGAGRGAGAGAGRRDSAGQGARADACAEAGSGTDAGAGRGAGAGPAAAHDSTRRDPGATRARILKAAVREFSGKGVSGARVDAIAARAGANKRMLYHYFGSKSDLFREVLRRELGERVERSRDQGGSRIARLVQRQATHARDRAWVRLLMWEALEMPARQTADGAGRERWYHDWVEGLRADQEAGRIPADLDVAQLALSDLALTMFPAAFPQLTRWITGRSVTDPEFVAERQRFLEVFGRRFYLDDDDADGGRDR